MGEVFRARDTKLDRDVAIKVLPTARFLAMELDGAQQTEANIWMVERRKTAKSRR